MGQLNKLKPLVEITPVFYLNVKSRYYTKVYLKGYETVRFSNCERPFFILEKNSRKKFPKHCISDEILLHKCLEKGTLKR